MRRFLSTTLLLLLVLPAFAAALLQTTDVDVPMCCKAKGKHHCLMSIPERVSKGGIAAGVVRENCPSLPRPSVSASSQLTSPQEQLGLAVTVTSPKPILQAEARYRSLWGRSRQKRGPPTLLVNSPRES